MYLDAGVFQLYLLKKCEDKTSLFSNHDLFFLVSFCILFDPHL